MPFKKLEIKCGPIKTTVNRGGGVDVIAGDVIVLVLMIVLSSGVDVTAGGAVAVLVYHGDDVVDGVSVGVVAILVLMLVLIW